jgi:hypothetical protein
MYMKIEVGYCLIYYIFVYIKSNPRHVLKARKKEVDIFV